MGNKILFINACVREASRTLELSQYLLGRMQGEIAKVNLYKEHILPLDGKGLEKRTLQDYAENDLHLAKQFKGADTIVIAGFILPVGS